MAQVPRVRGRSALLLALSLAGCASGRASYEGVLLPDLKLVDLARELERVPAERASSPTAPIRAPRSASAASDEPFELALEVQGYPAGVITTVAGHVPLSAHEVLSLRAGYNATDRRDFGEHDDEDGGGPGLGAGYRRYFGERRTGWLLGGRVDLWFLEIDWEDDADPGPADRGSSDVVVLQPTLEGGYAFRLGERARLDLTLALGAEVNVDTDGEDVGEGGILLGGVGLAWGF